MMNSYFLDTSYSIALAVEDDQLHQKAVKISFELENGNCRIFTTQPILLEIGNSMAKSKHRFMAVEILRQLESDTKTRIVSFTPELYDRALNLFCDRTDKEWGLVDCFSFVVMEQLGIKMALTNDRHFVQAGFLALLRED